MNRQYWRPHLHFIYLPYILCSIMYLISSFLCISIRKPSRRTTFKQVKEHHLGRKQKNHTGPALSEISQVASWYQLPYVPISFCHLLLLDIQFWLDLIFGGFVFHQFSRPNGFPEGPQDCASWHGRRSRNPWQQGGAGDSNTLDVSQP